MRNLIQDIKGDLPSAQQSFKGFVFNYLFNPGFRILLNYRLRKRLINSKLKFVKYIGFYYRRQLITKRNCDFSSYCEIGRGLHLPHPIGIVIGDGVVVKDKVTIFQQVTLGSHGKQEDAMAYPRVERGVKIYAGAKIIGGVTIGENAIIGANAVVNIDIPANSIAVGIPCKIISR